MITKQDQTLTPSLMRSWEQVRKRLDQNAPLFGSAALSAGMILAREATPVRKRNELCHLTGSPVPP
jgi:hypothetical protein